MDIDGDVDFDDIGPFVQALSDPTGYETTFGVAATATGDTDSDGDLDFDDIGPFVDTLQGAPSPPSTDSSPPQFGNTDVSPETIDVSLGFSNGLNGWAIGQSGGSAGGQGTVTTLDDRAVMREGDSFQVTLEHPFVVPDGADQLHFDLASADFDTTDPAFINDAFEAALLDANGQSLVHTFQGGRDAFFNFTEQQSPEVGLGTTYQEDAEGIHVSVDLSRLFGGTEATLVFRLVGNDTDRNTSVEIANVVVPGAISTIASDDAFTVAEDSGTTNLDVLGNDDGATLSILSAGPGSAGGVVTIVEGQTIDYTPARNFFGTETFTYTVSDGTPGNEVTALVTMTVTPLNDPPTARDDAFAVDQGSRAQRFDVLANDTIGPDTGETLAIFAAGPGSAGGQIAIVGDAAIDYAPAPGFFGTETFPYTVNDGTPGSNAVATVTVTVNELGVTVRAPDDLSADEGATVQFAGTFSDPRDGALHTATIFWGDGSQSSGNVTEASGRGTVTATHVYADDGIYPVTFRVVDSEANATSLELTATIGSVAPTVLPAADQQITEGSVVSLNVGTFVDSGFTRAAAGTAETFISTIDWGDGSPPVDGTISVAPGAPGILTSGSVSGQHVYLDEGEYTVTVNVSDDDSAIGSASFTVSVVNSGPRFLTAIDLDGNEGETAEFSAAFFDPGSADTHSAVVFWSDGSQSPATVSEADGLGTVTASHQFADNGLYPVSIELSDNAGASTTIGVNGTIANTAPTVTPTADQTAVIQET
ncbi:MAG: Ig-like domain-containing protein, partial [Pirellulales bacterium]